MARQRDYAAEYRRRIERAQEKAQREGTEFSRHKARGHQSREYERNQGIKYRAKKRYKTPGGGTNWPSLIEATRCGMPAEEWSADVAFARKYMGDAWTLGRLSQKLADMRGYQRDGSTAESRRKWGEYMDSNTFVETPLGDQFLPESLWYYRGAE